MDLLIALLITWKSLGLAVPPLQSALAPCFTRRTWLREFGGGVDLARYMITQALVTNLFSCCS